MKNVLYITINHRIWKMFSGSNWASHYEMLNFEWLTMICRENLDHHIALYSASLNWNITCYTQTERIGPLASKLGHEITWPKLKQNWLSLVSFTTKYDVNSSTIETSKEKCSQDLIRSSETKNRLHHSSGVRVLTSPNKKMSVMPK